MPVDLRALLPVSRPEQRGRKLNAQERAALRVLQREARARDAILTTGGEGGLAPSFVLGIMRRDEYRCKRCGTNESLGVHHKGGLKHPPSAWLAAKGKRNDANNVATICEACHDAIHNEDRNRAPVDDKPVIEDAPHNPSQE